ncbi:uncharacterized protein FIBRA_02091 [Fibroporia radiculosa]|uniref:Protein kinase domain-containing protein n=1 Tax=Fibroporia radiculosa TaxID=599839 RepID=J4H1N1_9APHY|nr:uncharacterized protein FIBRA_02091 [Fibroporia radiculosa]CCM00064.1 predicted protein [Fibroporia radiculosa]
MSRCVTSASGRAIAIVGISGEHTRVVLRSTKPCAATISISPSSFASFPSPLPPPRPPTRPRRTRSPLRYLVWSVSSFLQSPVSSLTASIPASLFNPRSSSALPFAATCLLSVSPGLFDVAGRRPARLQPTGLSRRPYLEKTHCSPPACSSHEHHSVQVGLPISPILFFLRTEFQLPPLSVTSSKRTPLVRRETSDDFQNGSLSHKRAVYVNDKSASPTSLHVVPLPISTTFSSTSSPSSTAPSTPFLVSKQIPRSPRSPLASSPRELPSPIPRSPHPFKSSLSPSLPCVDDKSSKSSSIASVAMDVLAQGDLVGEGLTLQGEMIIRVPISSSEPRVDDDEPAKEFEVVRRLGTGSYAVVYLVREVLSRTASPSSDDGHGAAVAGRMELDDSYFGHRSPVYGREYAVKLLSKANLDEDALSAQLFEATIHQSLPAHPNIVTLHRTLETPSFLLLLLEFVPGEDLFYFLEQDRDHYDVDPALSEEFSTTPPSESSCSSRTPSTPSLLASLAPSQLLSRTRLRLISSMFLQMCEAVATCHDHSIFHRDIKPENFIVTDGWSTLSDGRRERKVVVKLTDFGLSTTDTDSADMDCGSAPYMSFECRNNLHPTYSPRAADVWSLGIVLINMLYHYNPWTDASQGVCTSFDAYCHQPVNFFMTRFTGMTLPVAEFLAKNVFCILDNHKDDSQRIGARAFGAWIKDLPTLLGGPSVARHTRTVSISSVQGHHLASIPHSRRPSLRCVTPNDIAVSQRASRSMSRAPSLGPAYEVEAEVSMLSTVTDYENEEQEQDGEIDQEPGSRSASTHRRRKRGTRKGKGNHPSSPPSSVQDGTLATLAEASQALAREISRTSRNSQHFSTGLQTPIDKPSPVIPYVPVPTLSPTPAYASAAASTSTASVVAPPTITKKSSKWKLSFGKGSNGSKVSPVEESPSELGSGNSYVKPMSSTASNVTSLLMSLNAPPAASTSQAELDTMGSWTNRGRRPQPSLYGASNNGSSTWGPNGSTSAFSTNSNLSERRGPHGSQRAVSPVSKRGVSPSSKRGISPTSTRSGRPLASSASSIASSNWRSSMSSAGTSTSAFTRYSNGSSRSVSTAATSLSSGSWRSNGTNTSTMSKKYPVEHRPAGMPANVKFMAGTPWELSQMPRPLNHDPDNYLYGAPPTRKRRGAKAKDSTLDTISERPQQKSVAQRMDAATSTTDLSRIQRDGDSNEVDHDTSPRKVQKGQINALAKMLSALRR